jgi:hypothetical protein
VLGTARARVAGDVGQLGVALRSQTELPAAIEAPGDERAIPATSIWLRRVGDRR